MRYGGELTDDEVFAELVASLGAKVWLDAHAGVYLGLSGSLINSATDRAGNGLSAAQVGANRPTFDPAAFGGRGGMVFAGNHWLLTPAFAMGNRASCAIVFRPTAQPGGAVEFGPVNSHSSILVDSGNVRARAMGAGDLVAAVTYPTTLRVVWRCRNGTAQGRALINGVAVGPSGNSIQAAATQQFCVGALGAGTVFRLNGSIGEVVWADAFWSDAELLEMDAALAARW